MARVGVVLSGCGVQDGSEIYESVLTLLALSKRGAEAVCLAPNVVQKHVVDHLSGKQSKEQRNVMAESARIARGVVEDLDDVEADDLDALILPGGYGAAKNLSTFAFDGPDCQVLPELERLVQDMHEAGKPIGAICIAPVVISKILEGKGIKLTIGNDEETKGSIEEMDNEHVDCDVDEICVDEKHKIVSTPAYMLAESVAEANEGIEKLVEQVLKFTEPQE